MYNKKSYKIKYLNCRLFYPFPFLCKFQYSTFIIFQETESKSTRYFISNVLFLSNFHSLLFCLQSKRIKNFVTLYKNTELMKNSLKQQEKKSDVTPVLYWCTCTDSKQQQQQKEHL